MIRIIDDMIITGHDICVNRLEFIYQIIEMEKCRRSIFKFEIVAQPRHLLKAKKTKIAKLNTVLK